MTPHVLEYETKLYAPLDEVFAFFGDPANLNKVTPADLDFTFLTPLPIRSAVGAVIDYRIKLMGIPFFWRTLITDWQPPHRFVDQQLRGPYVFWHHQHTFAERDGYVLMTDRVHYLSPGWIFEPLIDRLFVRRQLEKIWAYRGQQFEKMFGKKDVTI